MSAENPADDVDFDDPAVWQYELPPELIAARPSVERDGARLLVVDRSTGRISHRWVRELPQLLASGDLLVFNNTRVLPARLFGWRTATGGRWEGLFLRAVSADCWELMCETRGRLVSGEQVTVVPARNGEGESAGAGSDRVTPDSLSLRLLERDGEGIWRVRPEDPRPFDVLLAEFGSLPLPPYLGRRRADADDENRYQTCLARVPGAIAAPTAGLHFTPQLLARCAESGVLRSEVTLHVGAGTFRPVKAERISGHAMHSEWCEVPEDCAGAVAATSAQGGRTVAVGTTTVRTLESAARHSGGSLAAWRGETDLFIRPPFEFRVIDALLTNFHLPGSTLLIMIAAFAGYDLVMEAYRAAIAERYRFFSYGDAMLIL